VDLGKTPSRFRCECTWRRRASIPLPPASAAGSAN
jgi:hypothetical protein